MHLSTRKRAKDAGKLVRIQHCPAAVFRNESRIMVLGDWEAATVGKLNACKSEDLLLPVGKPTAIIKGDCGAMRCSLCTFYPSMHEGLACRLEI